MYLLGAQFNNVGCMHNIFITTFILTFAVSVLAVLKHNVLIKLLHFTNNFNHFFGIVWSITQIVIDFVCMLHQLFLH